MVSSETLRRHRFFGSLSAGQIRAVAMITEEKCYPQGARIFETGQNATALYFLHDGAVELIYEADDAARPEAMRHIHIGDVVPGDFFGVSALLETQELRAAAVTTQDCKVLRMEAAALRALCQLDQSLELSLMRQLVKALHQRLDDTRTHLAASRA